MDELPRTYNGVGGSTKRHLLHGVYSLDLLLELYLIEICFNHYFCDPTGLWWFMDIGWYWPKTWYPLVPWFSHGVAAVHGVNSQSPMVPSWSIPKSLYSGCLSPFFDGQNIIEIIEYPHEMAGETINHRMITSTYSPRKKMVPSRNTMAVISSTSCTQIPSIYP